MFQFVEADAQSGLPAESVNRWGSAYTARCRFALPFDAE